MSKYFPIQTETACALKWSWNTLRLYNGLTSSCHRVDGDIIGVENFDTFHNTPKKIADRELMLNGQWPQGGCEFCKNVEAVGGDSDRQFHLKIPDQHPRELDADATLTHVAPTILEIYFDNVCNMKCLYCWDGFSSQIQQENKKFGEYRNAGVVIKNLATKHPESDALKNQFWNWMDQHSQTLRRLHILGGEPFYQQDFTTCLDFLDNRKHPNLEFNIVSNLMIRPDVFQAHIQRIKQLVGKRKIKRFDLTASIDCWAPEVEYVRAGLDLTVWKENFEYLVNEKWIYLSINQTLTPLTIKTIPELVAYINRQRVDREIGHYMSPVSMTHDFLHPGIFGKGFFKTDFDAIILLMPEHTWQQCEAKKQMQGIANLIEHGTRDQTIIDQLAIYLTEMDRRRNTNWKNTFPWLTKEITNVV